MPRTSPTAGMHREFFAVRYHMLGATGPDDDGYWMAERLDPDRAPMVACHWLAPGKLIPNDGRFYLCLSGRQEVLSRYQVEMRVAACESRGEIVRLDYVSSLPEGSIVI